MGQKVNPNGLRLGINREWSSHWYADKKHFASYLQEDIKIRKYLEPKLDKQDAGLSHIDIERIKNDITISIHVSHPAVVIGQDSANIKQIRGDLAKILNRKADSAKVSIVEVKNPDLDAVLVAKDIAKQIEQRASFRVVQKKAIQRVMRAGAKGCKTMAKGVSAVPKSPATRSIATASSPSTPSVSRSIMLTSMPIPPMASSASRSGSPFRRITRNSATSAPRPVASDAAASIATTAVPTAATRTDPTPERRPKPPRRLRFKKENKDATA